VLGGLAILAPRMPRLKEWAYAGMVFDLTGAAASRAFSGDGVIATLIPLWITIDAPAAQPPPLVITPTVPAPRSAGPLASACVHEASTWTLLDVPWTLDQTPTDDRRESLELSC
jgi:hypothetical protein